MPKRLLIALFCLAWCLPAHADNEVLAIIVQRSQVTHQINNAELALIFWRKKLYWADNKRMQPVNLATNHPARRLFSQRILGSLPETQNDYWNEMYFQGTSPPYVVNSNEAMLRFVAETPGAIGYIDACRVDARIKAVAWLSSDGNVSSSEPAHKCE